jgi:hypothetical protein
MRGGPVSHIDQGRHSRFTARVLLRPGSANQNLGQNVLKIVSNKSARSRKKFQTV